VRKAASFTNTTKLYGKLVPAAPLVKVRLLLLLRFKCPMSDPSAAETRLERERQHINYITSK